MDSTTPAAAQSDAAAAPPPGFETLAMVTAAVTNNTNLNIAAMLATAPPNPTFLNALTSAFPLYSVAGTTNLLNAIVATNTTSLPPSVVPPPTTGSSAFLTAASQPPQQQFNGMLSSNAHCSCTPFAPNGVSAPTHSTMSAQNGQDERPTPSNFLRSSRKRPLTDAGIQSSGSSRQPPAKYQRISASGQRRPDTPIISPAGSPPQIQPPATNLTEHLLESVVNAAFTQQQEQQSTTTMSAAINFNSRNLANAFLQQQHQQTQQQQNVQQTATGQSCPVCHNRQIQPTTSATILSPPVALQPSTVIAAQQASLLPSTGQTFIIPPTYPTAPTTSLQLSTVDEAPNSGCVCSGFHCARCTVASAEQQREELGAWLSRTQSANGTNPMAGAGTTTATPNHVQSEILALALNRVQPFPTATQSAVPTSRIRYSNQLFQQQLALLQAGVPSISNRSIPHQMARASSLTGASPFSNSSTTANNTHPDHINLLNHRQQAQRQSNDYINRFYATNSVVLPTPAQQTIQSQPLSAQIQATQNALTNSYNMQANHLAMREARLSSSATPANLLPFPANNHSPLVLLSNIHNIHHQLATDMPMIFFPASTNGDYVLGNPEAVTHAVATAMHHAPEPQPVGASLDQIKRCTQIRNYVKDPDVPEQERERCTVCLMDFETGEDIRTLHCSHMFHIDCIDRWLSYNKKCPICRLDMDKLPLLITDNEEETLGLAAAAQ